MGIRDWGKNGVAYIDERELKNSELRVKVGGSEEISKLAERAPGSLIRVAGECLRRVQDLPVYPTERPGKLKLPLYDVKARYVQKYVKETLALAEEVARAGTFEEPLEYLKRAYGHLEWSFHAGPMPSLSPLLLEAINLNYSIRWLCEGKIDSFVNFMFMSLSGEILLGLAESAEFSKSLEDFVLDEVARIRAERTGDPGGLEGATMPQVAKDADKEHAVALLGQLSGLMDSNPSVLDGLWPTLSELTLRVAETTVKTHPEPVLGFHEDFSRVIEPHRTPSKEPNLNIRQAAERIGISTGRVHQLYKEERLGIEVNGNPRFSEFECDEYRDGERKPGRRKKGDDAS